MTRWIWAPVGAAVAAFLFCQSAAAITPFNKAFEEKYVKGHANPAFQEAYKKTRCNVCHVKGEPKKVVNAYGEELAKLIEGNAEERLREAKKANREKDEELAILKELEAAFVAVEKVKSNAKVESSPTFGEVIQSGKLPSGGE